jgi:hypothetical protein
MPGAGSPDRYRGATCSSPSPLVQGPDRLLDLRIADYQESPALHISAARGTDARFQDLANQFVRHRIWFQSPHRPGAANDFEQIRAVAFIGLAFSRLAQQRLSDRAGWCNDRLRRTDQRACPQRPPRRRRMSCKTAGWQINRRFEVPMKGEPPMALYELRTYTLYVGKMAEAVKLYQEIVFPALQRGGRTRNLSDISRATRAQSSTCTPLEIR